MRRHAAFICAAISAVLPLSISVDARPNVSGEEELSKLLAGRVAGRPQNCITTFPSSEIRAIDRTAYVFGHGRTIYVNRTQDPDTIDDDHVLVIRRFGSGTQLCSTDIITTLDRSSHIYSGNVSLGEFVPYHRAK